MAENGPVWDPVFDRKNPPETVYVGPFFGVLSQEMRHMNFFLGAQMGGFWVGPKSLCANSAPFVRFSLSLLVIPLD